MNAKSWIIAAAAVAGAGLLLAAGLETTHLRWIAIVTAAVLAGTLERSGTPLVPGSRASASFMPIVAVGAVAGPFGSGVAGLAAGLAGSLFRGRPASRSVFNGGSLLGFGG